MVRIRFGTPLSFAVEDLRTCGYLCASGDVSSVASSEPRIDPMSRLTIEPRRVAAKPFRSIFERSLDGESRIKLFREHRGMTQATLARRVGLSALYVSQLETKRRSGSQATLHKIASTST